ncbi:hypothetical protein METBIDRAFT_40107 [Metschnikowia bicuspidata var. bicuspidata NRRL YB-4993]|uniref:Multicopper oxidase n=1 Tax=Metschnikowia bicuspidata var. bicuspidata NRRL YB-4993 TaxID=869754 RepID=A0A1A0HEQ3_9ASCO|nr:hypothetical protein METBIDRAFT_40107 [Metschnikowia bicuspidata var. bicuspidata NRRL YB-4993]OBA22481.1 hypothetical protein METBIDRAFT_40107 [Metschnikowia bicuspidata var. bicuspidata NRRL YB-4993]
MARFSFLYPLYLCLVPWCGAETRTYEFTLGEAYVAQDGTYKAIKTINGASPGPTIEADENDWISVKVVNHLQVPAAVHFHGILQRGTPWLDGVPGITQRPIASGSSYTYFFQAKDQCGAFWYHSHYRGYLSDGLYGLIYIRPAAQRQRPYALVTKSAGELQAIAELEKHPASLIADDSFHVSTDTLFLRMFQHGIDPLCIQSIVVNGQGRVVCHQPRLFRRLAAKNPFLMQIPEFDSLGCVKDPALRMFDGLPIDHEGLQAPGFSGPCHATRSPVHVHFTNHSRWQYINVLNPGGQNTKAFSIDDHPFFLVAVDGVFVHPKQYHSLLIPVGSRCTVLVETDPDKHVDVLRPFAIRFAASHTPQYIEGIALLFYGHSNEAHASLELDQDFTAYAHGTKYQDLDGQLLSRTDRSGWLHETEPFETSSLLTAAGAADVTYNFFLRMFDTVQFTMFASRAQLSPHFETSRPLLDVWYDSRLDDLPPADQSAILHPPARMGQTVDLIINNNKHINHPIHLHGHYVHLLSYSVHENFPFSTLTDAIEGNCSTLNVKNPPLLDVVLIPVGGHAVLRFVADNPGIWLLHCHNIGHLMGGMGAILLEALEDIPQMAPPEG